MALGLAGTAAGAAPAASAAAFGYTSSGYDTVTTGGGLVFKINQSTGGMTSLNINGISGSGALSDWLSPAVSYDCVEMY